MVRMKNVLKGIGHNYGSLVNTRNDIKYNSSGLSKLDDIIGGGWPEGSLIEFYGCNNSGKSMLGLRAIAERHTQDEICCYIGASNFIDLKNVTGLGINPELLYISYPLNIEDGLEIIESMVNLPEVRLIVIDSITGLLPSLELDSCIGTDFKWLQSSIVTQGFGKLSSIIAKTKTTLIYVNNVRVNFNKHINTSWVSSCGQSLKFMTPLRIECSVKDDTNLKIEITKNKVNGRLGSMEYNIA